MILDDLTLASRAKKCELDHFIYTAIFNTIGAVTTITLQVSITADSDFLWRYTQLAAYAVAGTNLANPDFLVTFFDAGSGRNLQDATTHVNNVCGTGQRPFVLPEPRLIKGSSILSVTLQNLTAVATRVDINFSGFKIFWYPGYSRQDL